MEAPGLHLWNVELSGCSSRLWITTKKRDLTTATKKATTFARNHAEYCDHDLKAIHYHGTIDA